MQKCYLALSAARLSPKNLQRARIFAKVEWHSMYRWFDDLRTKKMSSRGKSKLATTPLPLSGVYVAHGKARCDRAN